MYVRCIKSLNKANKQHRKRSIEQVTSGKCYLLLLLENGGFAMQNTRILEMLNYGQIEELKTLIQEEIFKDGLKISQAQNNDMQP